MDPAQTFERKLQSINQQHTGLTITYRILGKRKKTAVLFLEGFLDTKNSYDFISLVELLIKKSKNPSRIVIDCHALNYITSTGIGAFTNILVSCKTMKIELLLNRLPKKIRDTIDLLGFTGYFLITEKTAWDENE